MGGGRIGRDGRESLHGEGDDGVDGWYVGVESLAMGWEVGPLNWKLLGAVKWAVLQF